MTLARRMWLASVILAFIVVAAFAALIVAISAQREATAREARSRDVTAASLRLEKLVVDMETGLRGLTLTERPQVPRSRTRTRARRCPSSGRRLQALVVNDPVQRRRAQERGAEDPGVRRRSWTRSSPSRSETPAIGEEPLVAEEGKRLTDEIRRRLRSLPRRRGRARRRRRPSDAERRSEPRRDRRRDRHRRLDSADHPLRRLPRALDRPAGARRRLGRQPARRRRVVAAPPRGRARARSAS